MEKVQAVFDVDLLTLVMDREIPLSKVMAISL